MTCAELIRLYKRHLTLKQVPVEETFDDMVLLPLGYQREGEFLVQVMSEDFTAAG
jgi:hypothetical protein